METLLITTQLYRLVLAQHLDAGFTKHLPLALLHKSTNVIFYNQLKQRFDESDEPFEGEHLRIPKLSNHQTKPVMCDDSHD